ncbi:hypothetical protein [Nocardia sp. NPDC019255]|uniref:hypothetical protein n=1 Tax=Nocardia sp. NPDC019255 TaxID=3154591 RepID=UPI0033D7730F
MPDGYDRDRDKVRNHERGRIFENGTGRFFSDRENGYVQQSRLYRVEGVGKTRFDKIKDDRGIISSIEEKSGRIEGDKDETQLKVIRALLANREVHQHTLRSVEGEFISSKAQELIRGLLRDFGDRFTHQVISRADAREIWARGLALERGQQLELPGVGEKARQQKAQQREHRSKLAELANKARERAEKFRNMLRFREGAARGRVEAPQRAEHARQVHEQAERARQAPRAPETEPARVAREAAERVAREFPAPDQHQERSAADTEERAAREAAEARAAEREAAEKQRAAAEQEREAAEQERAEHLARLQAQGMPPEVVKILGLGQAEPPSAAVREPPGHAPSAVRGYWHSQDRSRGIERNR